LLEKGANVNAKSISSDTALVYAVRREASEELIKTLINFGANVNDKNNDGESPLNLATKKGMTKIEAILREYGAVE
jgi:ankyrin repeat protein